MARGRHLLSPKQVEHAGSGRYADGGGLYRRVTDSSRFWVYRFTSPTTGKLRELGVGSADTVSLKAARKRAQSARECVAAKLDPISERERERQHVAEADRARLHFERLAFGGRWHDGAGRLDRAPGSEVQTLPSRRVVRHGVRSRGLPTLIGTTIPSDSRCVALNFAFGLYEPPCRDSGCTDGSLVFRASPCTRAAPHTPPESFTGFAPVLDVAFAVT